MVGWVLGVGLLSEILDKSRGGFEKYHNKWVILINQRGQIIILQKKRG